MRHEILEQFLSSNETELTQRLAERFLDFDIMLTVAEAVCKQISVDI
jgi:hypothetical protein